MSLLNDYCLELHYFISSLDSAVSLVRETAEDLNLPFRVTNSYAPQRFMSSSYLSLKRLELSYEAYVETFRDHQNDEESLYKLCGNDFVHDL